MAEEKQFENKIKNFLKELPRCWFYKNWGGGFGTSGIADIIACINGSFVAIEVKASRGKPSPLQLRNDRLIKECNGYSFIVYPKDFEELKEKLIKISKGID